MKREAVSRHWLVDIAVRAGFSGAESVVAEPGSPLADVWGRVADAAGLSFDKLANEVAESLRLPVANLDAIDPVALRLVPEKVARRFMVLPLRQSDRQIVVAVCDPLRDDLESTVRFASGRQPVFEVASPWALLATFDRAYAAEPRLDKYFEDSNAAGLEDSVQIVQPDGPEQVVSDDAESAPVVRLTNLILRNAVIERASDIHLEPGPGGGTVRYRVDGVMRTHMRMPMPALNRVVSRIKIMGRLDIADRLRPQDGRARVVVEGDEIDLRISTVPTRDSEKAVVRLLRQDTALTLDDLGLPERDLRALKSLIGHRNGIVAVTGPTGSGKTTTLYAAIRQLANGESNISTVEDPIEYELPGITQMQVESKREFTFAAALRAVLRQDPDVILVGEIRDHETADIAVQASMTGHLVLTTLHTNDAAGAVTRLADLGVDRPALAATLRGVVAQRLVRKLCTHCAAAVDTPNEDEKPLVAKYGVKPVRRAVGCERCGQTGYRGRTSILEVLQVGPAVQECIAKLATSAELVRAAQAAGMHGILESGLARVAEGQTTLQEIERVVGESHEPRVESAGGGPHVLIVDDDPVVRSVARALLEREAYRVSEVGSGEAALEFLRTDDSVVLAVLDLGLPAMQGPEVLKAIRSAPATASLTVVVLTASDDPEAEVSLMENGADDYVRKPLEARRFGARIKAALRRAAA